MGDLKVYELLDCSPAITCANIETKCPAAGGTKVSAVAKTSTIPLLFERLRWPIENPRNS